MKHEGRGVIRLGDATDHGGKVTSASSGSTVMGKTAALAKMLALFGVPDLQYEVRLILSPPCITPLLLSDNPSERRRLGWTTFFQTAQGKAGGAEVPYLLQLA